MKKKNIFRGTAIVFLLVTLVLATTAFVDRYHYVDKKLQTIEAVLSNYYVGEIDQTKLQEGIYKGFVEGVGDAYTAYFTSEEYTSFKEKSSGIYAGIGIQMSLQSYDNSIEITEIFEGSPAQEANIKIGDRIIEAAGKSVSGDDFQILPSLVKGTPGTTVDMTIYRPSENKTYHVTLKRANITTPSVYFEMLEDDIGYIRITSFEEVTYEQFKEALGKLDSEEAKGLVLDLRNNPGGLLNSVEKIADELVPEGIVVSTKDKNGEGSEYFADSKYNNIPMVVLINGSSASASEVLAGALKDYKRAELIGNTTYGKGVVQTLIPLTDGSAIKLTTSQYFTPSGVCIQGIGIKPDYEVSLSTEKLLKGRDLKHTEDDQLQTALKVIREKIQ